MNEVSEKFAFIWDSWSDLQDDEFSGRNQIEQHPWWCFVISEFRASKVVPPSRGRFGGGVTMATIFYVIEAGWGSFV